jgi:hypothetical protein
LVFKPTFGWLLAVVVINGLTARPLEAATALTSQDIILDVTEPGQWRPTEAQVTEAKAALLSYLYSDDHHATDPAQKYAELMRPDIQARINSYSLQYFGGYYSWDHSGWDPDGDKEILINGLCESFVKAEHIELSKQLVSVNDGGACFFQAGYSVAQRKIAHFAVNGRA